MRAMQTAATGMAAQEMNVQVISNNIANVRTTGFKRQTINFQDLLYQNFLRAGSATSDQNTQSPAATAVSINAQGTVEATIPGQIAPQSLGQIQLTRFVNKSGLESIGDNLFIETAASGQPIDGFGGGEGFGTLQQNYLEEGNVQAVT